MAKNYSSRVRILISVLKGWCRGAAFIQYQIAQPFLDFLDFATVTLINYCFNTLWYRRALWYRRKLYVQKSYRIPRVLPFHTYLCMFQTPSNMKRIYYIAGRICWDLLLWCQFDIETIFRNLEIKFGLNVKTLTSLLLCCRRK